MDSPLCQPSQKVFRAPRGTRLASPRASRTPPTGFVAQHRDCPGRQATLCQCHGDSTSQCPGQPATRRGLLRRSQGGGVINTAYIERSNATFRQRLAPLARRTRCPAQQRPEGPRTLTMGMYLVGCLYNLCDVHGVCAGGSGSLSAAIAGFNSHRPWLPVSPTTSGLSKSCSGSKCRHRLGRRPNAGDDPPNRPCVSLRSGAYECNRLTADPTACGWGGGYLTCWNSPLTTW